MKFTNILFLGAALVDSTQAFKLSDTHIDVAAAKSAAHAAAKYAKDHGGNKTHAVSQANATIKHYDGASAQSKVVPPHHTSTNLHVSDSKHDTTVKAGTGSPKQVVKMAAANAKKNGKDPVAAAKEAVKRITQAGHDAGIKPGPKNVVAATAHMAHDAGHDPTKAAQKAAKTITEKAKKVGGKTGTTSTATVSSLKHSDHKHDTVVKAGTGSPKQVVKMAAANAKKNGKDPVAAAKEAVKRITKAGHDAGIKPGPKNVVAATAHMAHDAGHNAKAAASKATKTITDKAKKVAGTTGTTSTHTATVSSLKHSDHKHDTAIKAGTGSPKQVVKMAAAHAKKNGKDPVAAAKEAVKRITQAGHDAGIKPGPKNVVAATAHMAHDAGHNAKAAASKAAKTITDKAKKVAGTSTKASSTTPAAHAATASTN